eukprot:TRINITY_DN48643_c0_g1_i1.p1 TRINITY_DN48643_c0_g1~~TRINITY_DN48643_c0_g1_i1.p1  ORF type:complete len:116 (-),score=6.00 TRINITY_DN48643_c0_g1_i1:34-381(-)
MQASEQGNFKKRKYQYSQELEETSLPEADQLFNNEIKSKQESIGPGMNDSMVYQIPKERITGTFGVHVYIPVSRCKVMDVGKNVLEKVQPIVCLFLIHMISHVKESVQYLVSYQS